MSRPIPRSKLERRPRSDLRILILNWRCPRNPKAGGAETLTFELARRLVRQGNSVEWFSSAFPGAPSNEDRDGIHFVRAGRQWSVHWQAFLRYRQSGRERFDAVIDEVNTMPFFTPLWIGIPTFMLMFQLAREVWWYESRFPLSAIGYMAEPFYLIPYRHVPVFTISKSTEGDLHGLGFKGPITVVPIGIEKVTAKTAAKADTPTFLYVGRLAPSKRIAHMLHALAQFHTATGNGILWLVGSGSERYEQSLAKLTRHLGIENSVVFWGRLPTADKHRLMAQAHSLLMTSVREGWGLVVTEANACGTPAIVYDVPGLRDSVRNELTGLVVPVGPRNLSAAMLRMTADSELRLRLAAEAQRWSATFSFDEAATLIRLALEQAQVA
jgi:glycosyltransferase involved in cell wall biosynthesis